METVQQMNVRIGSDLKRRGDKVLARWGLSPSEGVRGFYDLITRGDKRSEEALAAVSGKAPSTEEARAGQVPGLDANRPQGDRRQGRSCPGGL